MAPSPLDLIERARGRSAGQILAEGIGGFVLALAVAAISGLQTIVEFMLLPFNLLTQAAIASVQNLLIRPLGLTGPAFAISAEGIEVFGLFALPLTVAFVIIPTIVIVVGAAALGWTGFLPGTVVDFPLIDFFFTSPEEEEEQDAD